MKRWRRYVPLYVLVAITVVPIATAYISYYVAPPTAAPITNLFNHSGRYVILPLAIWTAAASTCVSWVAAGYRDGGRRAVDDSLVPRSS